MLRGFRRDRSVAAVRIDANARRNLWFASELVELPISSKRSNCQRFHTGAGVAESAYGDVALRNFGDLDF